MGVSDLLLVQIILRMLHDFQFCHVLIPPLLHANLNILAAESHSVFEDLLHAMGAKFGLIVLFIDLPDCALRQLLQGLMVCAFCPFYFDQDTGQVICFRHELDIKAAFAGLPV